MSPSPVMGGTLYVVGTPIGNLEDITLRAVRVLGEVDLVAAEDTRSARVLLGHHGISTATVSLHKDNEARRSEQVLEALARGQSVALISEAGMPGVSDPGQVLMQRCMAQGVPVDVIPGPSAVLTALLLSGFSTNPFMFHGFLPRRGKDRQDALSRLRHERATSVLFESPRRAAATLGDLAGAVGGDRPAALVREATKRFQEVVRLSLQELAGRYAQQAPRGEVTLVLAGAPEEQVTEQRLTAEVERRLAAGQTPREIADALAGLGRRRVYQLALGRKA